MVPFFLFLLVESLAFLVYDDLMFKEMIRISAALSVRDGAAFIFCNVTDMEILFSITPFRSLFYVL